MGFIIQLLNFLMFAINLYSGVLVIYALLSWVPQLYNNAFGRFIVGLSEPFLNLFRRLPLQIGMIDFTVMAALLVLQFGTHLLYSLIIGFL